MKKLLFVLAAFFCLSVAVIAQTPSLGKWKYSSTPYWIGNSTLATPVTYYFKGKDTVNVVVYHFAPQNKAEVKANIENRAISEKAILTADSVIKVLLPNFTIDTNKFFQLP
jgi:hypothetical protein